MKQPKRIPRRLKEKFPVNHNPKNWMLVSESKFYALVEHKTLGTRMRFDKFSGAIV